MKTQHLIYFILGLLLGLLICYFKNCGGEPAGLTEIDFYSEIKVNPKTGELIFIPVSSTQKSIIQKEGIDKMKVRIFSDNDTINFALDSLKEFTLLPDQFDVPKILPNVFGNTPIKFEVVLYKGNLTLAKNQIMLTDGIIWEDKIPMTPAANPGQTPPVSCVQSTSEIAVSAILDSDFDYECDLIWPIAPSEDNCVFLNIDGDILQFDFQHTAIMCQGGKVYYISALPPTGNTETRRIWTLNGTSGKVEGTNTVSKDIEVLIDAGAGENKSNPSKKIQGFNVFYLNGKISNAAVEATRIPRG